MTFLPRYHIKDNNNKNDIAYHERGTVRVLKRETIYVGERPPPSAKVAYTTPQQRKKEESEGLRGENDPIKFIYLRFDRWQVVGLSGLF